MLGCGIVWLTEPGAGVALHAELVKAAIPVGFGQVLENIFPTSIFDATAKRSGNGGAGAGTIRGPVRGGGLNGRDGGGGWVHGN